MARIIRMKRTSRFAANCLLCESADAQLGWQSFLEKRPRSSKLSPSKDRTWILSLVDERPSSNSPPAQCTHSFATGALRRVYVNVISFVNPFH